MSKQFGQDGRNFYHEIIEYLIRCIFVSNKIIDIHIYQSFLSKCFSLILFFQKETKPNMAIQVKLGLMEPSCSRDGDMVTILRKVTFLEKVNVLWIVTILGLLTILVMVTIRREE